jgi:hypothetical protein
MKLVTNWNETLDKARVQCPQGAPKHQVQSPKPSVSIQPPTLEELESSLKWIQENPTPNNREHVASLEARIMEMKRK